MTDGKYLESCKSCARKYDNEGPRIPCIAAHKESMRKGGPVIWMMNGDEVGGNGPCVFLCSWGEVAEVALHPGKFSLNAPAQNWFPIVKQKIQGAPTYPNDPYIGKSNTLYVERNGRMMANSMVVMKATAGSQKWHDFERFFLQNCCADIKSLGGQIKFAWALEASWPHLAPEFKEVAKEMRENIVGTVGLMGAFAVIGLVPPLAPIALMAGVALDCQQVGQAAYLLGKFLQKVKDAERVEDIDEAGGIFAKFANEVLLAGTLALGTAAAARGARYVAKNMREWFGRTKEEWDRAQAPSTGHAEAPAQSAPPAEYHGESSRSIHKRHLDNAQAEVRLAGEAAARGDRKAFEEHMNNSENFKEQARLTREFHLETVGHIEAVNKLGHIFLQKYIHGLKQMDSMHRVERLMQLTAEFSRKYGEQFKMTDQEAYQVASDIEAIPPDCNFKAHDSTGAANKYLAAISEGLKLKDAPWSVWLKNTYNRAWEQYHNPPQKNMGPKRKTAEENALRGVPPEKFVEAEIAKLGPEKIRAMQRVDASRLSHSADNAHHHPKTPIDFFEYGCDVICAWVQDRSYRGGLQLPNIKFTLKNGEIFGVGRRGAGETTTVPRAAGWLKMMSMVMEETGELGYFKSPQTPVKQRGHGW